MIEIFQKRFFVERVKDILAEGGCEFTYNTEDMKIYTREGYDITEYLFALFSHYDKIEEEKWRVEFCNRFGIPPEVLYILPRKETKKKYNFVRDKKPKVYISGPITGRVEKEYKSDFNSTELWLTGLGYDVVNPISDGVIEGWGWSDYMRRDIKQLCSCDYIYFIKGWENSKGCCLEHDIAFQLGIKLLCLDENGKAV